MLVLRVCACVCVDVHVCVCVFRLLHLIFMTLTDNISSPVGKQFIRPSAVLFNGSLRAEAEFGP